MIVTSDHQPFLFGHTGHWSKILAADIHVAMFDVEYRQEDHLNSTGRHGLFGQRVVVPMVKGPVRIADQEFVDLKPTLKTLEQLLMAKKNEYRNRGEKILQVLHVAADRKYGYRDTWAAMAEEIKRQLGYKTDIRDSVHPVAGDTTFSRNVNRIIREAPETAIYLCGPAVLEYKKPDEHGGPWPKVVHRMNDQNVRNMLEVLVSEKDPWKILMDFSMKVVE